MHYNNNTRFYNYNLKHKTQFSVFNRQYTLFNFNVNFQWTVERTF